MKRECMLLGWILIWAATFKTNNGGQSCLSCTGIETQSECQHVVVCDNNEVCFVEKHVTESGAIIYDLGCAYEQLCRHGVGGIFGRRVSEDQQGHHIVCMSCCNNTQSCNIDLNCDGNHIDGQTHPRECSDINGTHPNGVYKIYPDGSNQAVSVYCDMHTEGAKWTVIQRRFNGSVDFKQNWQMYKEGFGYPNGEYWIGNDAIHLLTTHGRHELRIDMEDFEGNRRYAKYSTFLVGDEGSKYHLTVSGYSGNAGNSFGGGHNGMLFTTIERDNDHYGGNCANKYHGGWWYNSCHYTNLNGKYLNGSSPYGQGINWSDWRGFDYSLKSVKMMIRRM